MTSTSVNTISEHLPVMVSEVMSHLITDPNGIYIDGTIGLGGHSSLILDKLTTRGQLIGIDRDNDALSIAKNRLNDIGLNFSLFNNSYANSDVILNELRIPNVSGILLDLGLSSAQLDNVMRGFTYNGTGELDMRFDKNTGQSAKDILRTKTESEIAEFIRLYSDERFAKKIAYNIKKSVKMETVDDLREAIRRSTPPNKRNRSFARVFQAIRIVVNDELSQLQIFLEKFIKLLAVGGRIVIISFHSLEDRLVKHAFKKEKFDGNLSILTKRPLIAESEELTTNSRAKSAKMRAGERI